MGQYSSPALVLQSQNPKLWLLPSLSLLHPVAVAVAVAVVVWLLAVHETSVLGASKCLVLLQELLLISLA